MRFAMTMCRHEVATKDASFPQRDISKKFQSLYKMSCPCSKSKNKSQKVGLPDGSCMLDSIAVLAISYEQLLYGHCGFLVEQSCLLVVHCKEGRYMD